MDKEKKKLVVASGGRGGKTEYMRMAANQILDLHPSARVAIVYPGGYEIIENAEFEEVKPLTLPEGRSEESKK